MLSFHNIILGYLMAYQSVVLVILDGWGYREHLENNAIAAANTPTWDRLWQDNPHTLLEGSGCAVGLPDGQMGNSEVGHMNIGAGRVVYQDYTRINQSISSGEFASNPQLLETLHRLRDSNRYLHIIGLLSPGGVHSHDDHWVALIKLAAEHQFTRVICHAFLDGRDTPPQSAAASIARLENILQESYCPRIASLCGRYYAMDRDNRWDRVAKAYDLLTTGESAYQVNTAAEGLSLAYARGEGDEFTSPTWVKHSRVIQDGDAVIMMNFRADRARQLTRAFTDNDFTGFTRRLHPQLSECLTLTQYADDMNATVVFPPAPLHNTLGAYLASLGKRQLRIAETEKYAHVTFFFNGGIEAAYPNEERILVPSPLVSHYDLQPEMSAFEVTKTLVAAIHSQSYDLMVCNFANPDMVGHTGNFMAAVKAIEVIDQCLAAIAAAVQAVGAACLITADHGNAECMYDPETAQAHTAHTNEPVPLIYMGREAILIGPGALCDLAPTILAIMGLIPPQEMTGRCLLQFD